MKQTFETEVLGQLTKKQFDDFVRSLGQGLGVPVRIKRLSIQMTDFTRRNLDTRIRITNGQAEIMQKIGDWDAKTREEASIALPSNPKVILGHIKVLSRLLDQPSAQKNIIQMESYIYATPEYEVKLTQQYGGEDAYSFEVESLLEGVDPLDICKKFGLVPNLSHKDAAYWEKYNARVNLDVRTLSDGQMLDIISSYCS